MTDPQCNNDGTQLQDYYRENNEEYGEHNYVWGLYIATLSGGTPNPLIDLF